MIYKLSNYFCNFGPKLCDFYQSAKSRCAGKLKNPTHLFYNVIMY